MANKPLAATLTRTLTAKMLLFQLSKFQNCFLHFLLSRGLEIVSGWQSMFALFYRLIFFVVVISLLCFVFLFVCFVPCYIFFPVCGSLVLKIHYHSVAK